MKRIKISNKGFSLVELLAVLVILGILIGGALIAYTTYRKNARQQSYDTMAKSVTRSIEEYMMDNGNIKKLEISELVEKNYLKQTTDPVDKSKVCTGIVQVMQEAETEDALAANSYKVKLCCSKYKAEYTFPEGTTKKIDNCEADVEEEEEEIVIETPDITLYSWENSNDNPAGKVLTNLEKYNSGSWTQLPVISVPNLNQVGIDIDHYEYKTTGKIGNQKNITAEYLNITEEGISTVAWRVCIASGECSEYSDAVEIKINSKAPEAPTIINPTSGNWTNSSYSLTIKAHDDMTDIGSYQYTYNQNATDATPIGTNADNEWVEYADSAKKEFVTPEFTKERNQKVYIRACTKSGKCSTSSNTMIRIDKTKPSCDTWQGEDTAWINQDRIISVTCTDAGSGCTNSSYTKTITTEGKTASVSIPIKDNAGNTNTCTKSANVYIDKTPPIIGIRDFSTVFQLYDKLTAKGDEYFYGTPYESMYNNYKNDVVLLTGRDCSGITTANGPTSCDTAFQVTGQLFYYFAMTCEDDESGCDLTSKQKTCSSNNNFYGGFENPYSSWMGDMKFDNCTFPFLQGMSTTTECMTMKDNAGNESHPICINSSLTYLSSVPDGWKY